MKEIDHPNNFNALYNCKIQVTDDKVQYQAPYTFNYNDIQSINYMRPIEAEHIVTIKLPMSEYNKFLRNWNEYMLILDAGRVNPMINEQLHQLLMLATLYK